MNKISYGQGFAILLLMSSFGIVCASSAYSFGQMTGILISSVLQAILVLPIIYIYKKKNFSLEKSPKWILVLYTLYFLLYGGFSFSRFYNAARAMHFPINSRIFALILIAIVCLYSAMLGIKSVSRGSVLIFGLLVLSIIILFLGSYSKIDMDRFKWDDTGGIFKNCFSDFVFSSELAVIFVLFNLIGKNHAKCAYSFIIAKFILAEFISFIGITVLGCLSGSVQYPFFAIGSYSQPFSVQRADGIYIILFTMLCAVSITVYIIIASMLIKLVFPKLKYNETAVTILMLLISIMFNGINIAGWLYIVFAFVLYIGVPFFLMGCDKFEKKHG